MWKYDVVDVSGYDVMERRVTLNQWGEQGWELVCIEDGCLYFQRLLTPRNR